MLGFCKDKYHFTNGKKSKNKLTTNKYLNNSTFVGKRFYISHPIAFATYIHTCIFAVTSSIPASADRFQLMDTCRFFYYGLFFRDLLKKCKKHSYILYPLHKNNSNFTADTGTQVLGVQ